MILIRKRRNGYAFLFAASVCLALCLRFTFFSEVLFAFGAISLIFLLLFDKQIPFPYNATLTSHNRIFANLSALFFVLDHQLEKLRNLLNLPLVSSLEIKYPWSLYGVHGVRLHTL